MFLGIKKGTSKETKEIRAGTGGAGADIDAVNDVSDKKIMEETIEYLMHEPGTGNELIAAGGGSRKARESIMGRARQLLANRNVTGDRAEAIMELLQKFLWGYYILEPLLDDDEVSDVRVMDYQNVAVCRNGRYEKTSISFNNRDEYNAFMQSIAVMNQISLADINALQVVTDKRSHRDWILRIAIATGYLNSGDTYFMHIRKHSKVKRSLSELVRREMMPEWLKEYFKTRIKKGMVVGGRTGSGKTHFLNAMIDEIDINSTGICVQESEELFSSDPDSLIAFLHVVVKRGEGKIQYDLEDLSKFALLTSNEYFFNGEIKGSEAAYFANACYTGSICWTTVHSESCHDTVDKLCEYIMRATGYQRKFVMKMLLALETVVYISNYKIMEVLEIDGWDEDKGQIRYRQAYRREGYDGQAV